MSAPHPDDLTTGLLKIDQTGRVLWLNQAAADLIGRTKTQLTERNLLTIDGRLATWHARVVESQSAVEVAEEHFDGERSWVDLRLYPLKDKVLIEIHPVGERLHRRRIVDRAERQQALTLMARSLAHELRNPLAGMRGAAQLIEQADHPGAVARHAALIQREVDRMVALIERFSGTTEPAGDPVNVHQVLDESAELARAECADQLRVVRRYDPSIPRLNPGSGSLHQLFLNLLRNAVQAEARQLIVTTCIERDSAVIEGPGRHAVRVDIDDDGKGVPEALREHLFLPLVSGRAHGSGFGLAVAQQVARSRGGLIEYQPLAVGSRFSVRLPLPNQVL